MKKRYFALFLCFLILFYIIFSFKQNANAVGDPLTINMLGAATAAIGQSWGITFSSTWTAQGVQNMLEQEINTYSGGDIAGYFGSEAIRLSAGKLVVGQLAYNGIINFLRDLSKKYNLGENQATIGFMFANEYLQLGLDFDSRSITGFYTECEPGTRYNLVYWYGPNDYKSAGGGSIPISYSYISPAIYTVLSNGIRSSTLMANDVGATRIHNTTITFADMNRITGETYNIPVIAASTNDLSNATVLNPNQAWSGNVNGWEGPDTNLDQLIGQIYGDVADFNLDVDGEVVPLDPPQPVETWIPVDDVIDGINQGGDVLTDIGNDIGDISGHLDDLGEIGQDIVGELEGVQEGIETQTALISGALDQASQDIVDAIGDQTSTLDESLTSTAEDVETIAEALEDEPINWQKFDLRGLFPFCIPFDIYNMLEALDSSPTAPHVQLPFVIESIGFSYTIDLDFSAFDQVASVMRQMELIVYGIALAWATSKVIKW